MKRTLGLSSGLWRSSWRSAPAISCTARRRSARSSARSSSWWPTAPKLRQALTAKADAALAAAIDANLQATRAPRDPQLAAAAEQYILSAREITRRLADVDRLWRQAQTSRAALAGHMARASYRSDPWLRDALALKKRMENDYFDLGVQLKAIDELFYALPDVERRVEPHVGAAVLLEPALADSVRKKVQAEAKRAADELDRARNIR